MVARMARIAHTIRHPYRFLLLAALLAALSGSSSSCNVPMFLPMLVWSPDGTQAIAFSQAGLQRISDTGITPLTLDMSTAPPSASQPTTTQATHSDFFRMSDIMFTLPIVWLDNHTLILGDDNKTLQRFTLTGTTLHAGPIVARFPDGIVGMRLNPARTHLAVIHKTPENKKETFTLSIVSLNDPATVTPLRQNVGYAFDWTADGRSLVCIDVNTDEKKPSLATLECLPVFDDNNAVTKTPTSRTLAMLLAESTVSLKCLPDGRVVFPTLPLTLPAAANGNLTQSSLNLFAVDPHYTSTIPLLSSETQDRAAKCIDSSEGIYVALNLSPISPDGKYLALTSQDSRITLVNLATGDMTAVNETAVGDGKDSSLPALPVWRNNDELSFVLPADPKATPPIPAERVMIYNVKTKHSRLLATLPQPTTPPTSQPATTQPTATTSPSCRPEK